jgi:hypothetical protein
MFFYTLWRFYAFSGTNLLTRCHSASSCFLLFLCFRKVTQEIFSELNKTKAKVPIYLTQRRSPEERQRSARRQSHHRVPRHQVVWAPGVGPSAYKFPLSRNPKGENTFQRNILQATAVVDSRSGGSRSSSRQPAREGNHHQRPSSSPCQPPEWCVSSSPWTMGP